MPPIHDNTSVTPSLPLHDAAPAPNAAALRSARGAALRTARNLAGLSAQKLADRVNERTRGGSSISKDAIYAYEAGKVLLPHEVGVRLAAVLNLHPGELLAGDPDFRDPAQGAATDKARPQADTPTARWLHLAKEPVAVARVLSRILDARPMGDTRTQGFTSVFQILQTDLQAVIQHPIADAVRDARRSAEWDSLANVLTAVQDGLQAVKADFRKLLKKDCDPLDADTLAQEVARTLRQHAVTLETAITQANRLYEPAE